MQLIHRLHPSDYIRYFTKMDYNTSPFYIKRTTPQRSIFFFFYSEVEFVLLTYGHRMENGMRNIL